MLSQRENALRLFRDKQIPEYLPTYGQGIANNVPVNGYNERPKGGRAGVDWFGVEWTWAEGDPAPMPSSNYVLEDVCDWREVVKFPDMEQIDWEMAASIDRIPTFDREANMLMQMIHNGVFERLNCLMGMENSLISLITEPEECKAFFDAVAEHKCRLLEKMKKYYNPDIICYHDDWGSQHSMLFNPDLWSELIMPATKKIHDCCHDLGMLIQQHSDGMIKDIVPELVDECKPDSIQIMKINDIPALKKITGNKTVYDVFIDTQLLDSRLHAGILTDDFIRESMTKDFLELAEGGCYIPNFYMIDPRIKPVLDETFEAVRYNVYK